MKRESRKVQVERRQLKAFAEKNGCDAVLLVDGTIKQYLGERWNAVTIYKFKDNKFYDLGREVK